LQDLDDRLAVAFRKAVTRRTLLQRCMRFTLATGTAVSLSWKWGVGNAYASNCSYYGTRGTSCYCASTPDCGASLCSNGNVVAYHKRCNAWTQPNSAGQYCWCSERCWTGSPPRWGHYVCCDGWKQAHSGCNYSSGRSPCICLWWVNY